MEEWKEIELFGVVYKISNQGKVINKKTNRIIAQRLNQDGYKVITVGVAGNRKTQYVHRLVAILFVAKPISTEELEVNHIDLDRSNPNYLNLEWVTHRENVEHSHRRGRYVGRFGEDNPNYNNHKLSDIYKADIEYSKLKNGRKGVANGRSKSLKLYHRVEGYIRDFDYIGECCEYIKNTLNLSAKVVNMRDNLVKTSKQDCWYRNYRIEFN